MYVHIHILCTGRRSRSVNYDESDYFIYFLYLLRLNIVMCRTSVESLRNPSGGTYPESRYKVLSTAVVAANIYDIIFYNNL